MIPLSPAQRRLWCLNQLGEGVSCHVPFAVRLRGRLNVSALSAAMGDVIDRHAALRTVFPSQDGEPCQKILGPGSVPIWFHVVECTEDRLDIAITKANRRPIDITSEPPVRSWLFVLGPTEHVLLVVTHHIASDGWSVGPFLRDLGTAYAARCAGREPGFRPLAVNLTDYTIWQRETLGRLDDPGSLASKQLRFWTEALAGMPGELSLPTDRPRSAEPSHRGDVVRFAIDRDVHGRLVELARATQTTPFMVLQAGLTALLSRMGGGTDIPVGSVVSGRTEDALHDLVGLFANTLVLRVNTSGDPTFRELIGRVRETDLAACAHQALPFERVVEAISPMPTLSRHPLFQVMLVLRDNPESELVLPGLEVSRQAIVTGSAAYDLVAAFTERYDADGTPAGIGGMLEYEIALFDRDTVGALAARLVRLLEQVAADPDLPIGSVDVLDDIERHMLLVGWNDTAVSIPDDRCLHELFEEQVRRTPEATALIFHDSEVSYADLNAKANQLARYLIRHGIRRGDLVGIYLDRSPIVIAALLAVLKAGAAYTMLDPKFSAERLLGVLAESEVTTVITIGGRSARLAATDVDLIRLDAEMVGRIAHEADENLPNGAAPSDIACVIFIAGAGAPRGVASSHRALVGTYLGQRYVHFGPDQVFLQCSPVSWETFAFEVFGPLLFGGTTVLQPGQNPEPAVMARLVAKHEVTVLQLPASLFNVMVDEYPGVFRVVRQVLTGGEPASVTHVAKALQEFPGLHVVNGYGPAESMGFTTTFPVAEPDVTETTTIPIGRPVANKRTYVLDAALRPVPTGVVGEVYLAGASLAEGYLHRPGLTAERFVANPFGGQGERMYRTGDLARWRANGMLDLLGRADEQVRIRGFRVEPGEIESALTSHRSVVQAAVMLREDRPGRARLIAYVVPSDGRGVSIGALREHVSRLLPEHAIPAAVVALDALPLTPNGKLDRHALPEPDLAALPANRAPRTAREKAMCELFCDLLGLPEVGIDDSFLDLGGHSSLAARLISKIRSRFGAELTIRTVFESPTVAGLVERMDYLSHGRG